MILYKKIFYKSQSCFDKNLNYEDASYIIETFASILKNSLFKRLSRQYIYLYEKMGDVQKWLQTIKHPRL